MDNQHLSDLIGLIYDVAYDVTVWPRLLKFLTENMEVLLAEENQKRPIQLAAANIAVKKGSIVAFSDPSNDDLLSPSTVNGFTVRENALNDLLRSHCERAITLNRRINEAIEERNTMEELLQRLPLGMIVVDGEGRVLTYNHNIDLIMSESNGISIANGELKARLSKDTAKLKRMIQTIANGEEQESKAFNLSDPDGTTPISVLLFPFITRTNTNIARDNRVVILVASPELYLEITKESLMSLYNLTAAEARLVSLLVRDKNLEYIAEQFGTSKHTIRSQLKSVYEKTGTHRQAELVRQVITGPAMLAAIAERKADRGSPFLTSVKLPYAQKNQSKISQTIRLPDNRLLGYAEYGVQYGRPVILMHAVVGSRLQRHPDETIIDKLGIRLIVPDRPGVGLSDPKEDVTLLNWVDDLQYLVNHLGIKRFSVIGFSGGSAFALACAHQLQNRINRLVLVSGIAPFSSIWELGNTWTPYRMLWALGRHTPSLLGMLVRLARIAPKSEQLDLESSKYMKMPSIFGTHPMDASILKRIHEDTREGYRQGDLHILHEFILYANDWGFELGEIHVPVQLWVGEFDRIVPQMTNRLFDTLPHCQKKDVLGEGHYLLYAVWEEVLRST